MPLRKRQPTDLLTTDLLASRIANEKPLMRPRKTTRSSLSQEDLLRERLPVEIEDPERFDRWFEPLRRKATIAVLNVHREVTAALEDERKLLEVEEGARRRAWQMSGADAVSLLKSAESVRSKLARSLRESESKSKPWAGRLSLDQVTHKLLEFPDLGRFRIECDFSSDDQRVRRPHREASEVLEVLRHRGSIRRADDFVGPRPAEEGSSTGLRPGFPNHRLG